MKEIADLGPAGAIARTVSAEGYPNFTLTQSKVVPAMIDWLAIPAVVQPGTGKIASIAMRSIQKFSAHMIRRS